MPQLPENTSPIQTHPAGEPRDAAGDSGARFAQPAEQQAPDHRMPRWLERAELFLRVLLRMYIGIAVCFVPWSRLFWDQNPLFLHYPTLGVYASYGMVRGLITGLGLLNLWIAFQEAVQRWDK